jgi:hypothetical protein
MGIGFWVEGASAYKQNMVDIPVADKTSSELSRRQ